MANLESRTLVIAKVNVREKLERLLGDHAQCKALLQQQPLYATLLKQFCARVGADDASVFLLNAPEEYLEVVLTARADRAAFVGFKQPTNRGIVSMVVWNEHGINLSDVSGHEMFDDTADRTFQYKTRSMLAMPLHVAGRVVGVLGAVNKLSGPAFVDDDFMDLAVTAMNFSHVVRSQLLEKLVEM